MTQNNLPEKCNLVITRIFDASVELVWQAWTDPKLIVRWWGPDHFTCPFAEIDFRVGGKSILCMRAPEKFGGQEMYSTWDYTKIIPMKLIEYIHNLSDRNGNPIDPAVIGMPPEFPRNQRHTIAFKDSGNGRTELTVTEFDWPVSKMLEMSRMGMEQCLAKIASIFEGD